MSSQQVNGVKAHSQTLNHFVKYPLIDDLLKVYKQNSLGAKSIDLYNSLYQTFAEPVLPLLKTPYSIAAPYLEKVDSLGNSTLDWTDEHFPATKEVNLGNLREKAFEGAHYPFVLIGKTRDYVFSTYQDESKKVGGQGIVGFGKSVISTELKIAQDAYTSVIEFLGPRGKEFDQRAQDFLTNGKQKVDEYKKQGEKAVNDASKSAKNLQKDAEKTTNNVQKDAEKKTNDVKKSVNAN